MTEPRTFDDPELQAEYDEARASGIEYRCGTCGERQWWYGYTCVSCGDRFTLSQVPIDAAGALRGRRVSGYRELELWHPDSPGMRVTVRRYWPRYLWTPGPNAKGQPQAFATLGEVIRMYRRDARGQLPSPLSATP